MKLFKAVAYIEQTPYIFDTNARDNFKIRIILKENLQVF
ncbi:hypothetical protein UC3_02003 [Enterococcus phoeniculicola ATCC BAA-412]|uniref:Uncharacterized protein n=1 Tax=Enterococcus phoeniculicola ATCC BAA-412 TaxID=1158610 RepID=R3W5V1_9ENTE|nr:hypothetical protein UC3_02003 [Enterococcus phoeniculicola ATCC BAA-412]EOT76616.1 hypothetical protein I589_01573 [Enterococcus phoeniculicola ATCC BAA-412]